MISIKTFQELSNEELYQIIRLRSEVFVVEQGCVYQDLDNLDQESQHLMIWEDQKLVAYTRLLRKGLSYEDYTSIGRVVTSPSVRGTGIGKLLMKQSIKACLDLFGPESIKISAQCYLIPFYQSFGFELVGSEYLEDGIPHHGMVRKVPSV